MTPKVFISYCSKDEELAQRLKMDLSDARCDAWQFNLSAVPGTDGWREILSRIEKSDYFLLLLSSDALLSKPVRGEISHAHYCALNSPTELPKIIPLILDDGVVPPPEVIRKVRLPFSLTNYQSNFESLLKSIGVDLNPFRDATDQTVSATQVKEFDVAREVARFADALINNNPEVAAEFSAIIGGVNERQARLPYYGTRDPQPVEWTTDLFRHRDLNQRWTVIKSRYFVVYQLLSKHSKGYDCDERIILAIEAFHKIYFQEIGDTIEVASANLTLTFRGIQRGPIT